MPIPRKLLVDPSRTLYYHVTSRCVRRAYLCGSDYASGVNYEHRKEWIEQRIRLLSSIFAIEICAYAVMSNHYHIVLKLNPQEAAEWTNTEIVDRWRCLYRGPHLVERAVRGHSLTLIESATVSEMLSVYRSRLSSLSWFMKALNEPLARMANKEDGCTGHFWESRFRSQALYTTASLIACMAYVDLNPVRAKISTRPSQSDFTSIKERCNCEFNQKSAMAHQFEDRSLRYFSVPLRPLMRFENDESTSPSTSVVPISFQRYIELLEFTASNTLDTDTENLPQCAATVINQMRLTPEQWLIDAQHFEALYRLGAFRSPYHKAMSDSTDNTCSISSARSS